MSKISIKPNDSGTATFEIQAPAGNTNRTFVLPDEDGEILTSQSILQYSGNSGLSSTTVNDAIDEVLFNTNGKILQVVYSETTTTVTNTTTTYTNTGLSGVITKTKPDSVILVFSQQDIRPSTAATAAALYRTRILRTTEESTSARAEHRGNYRFRGSASSEYYSYSDTFLIADFIQTENEITYDIQTRIDSNTSSVQSRRGTMVIVEVSIAFIPGDDDDD